MVFFLMVAGSSQGKLFLTQHGGHSPANFNLFRFIQFSLRLFNKKLYTIYIRIKPAWRVRKHETQSCSESCVFSFRFSNPILYNIMYRVSIEL